MILNWWNEETMPKLDFHTIKIQEEGCARNPGSQVAEIGGRREEHPIEFPYILGKDQMDSIMQDRKRNDSQS